MRAIGTAWVLATALVLATGAAAAAGGAAELHLDATALNELLDAGLPEPFVVRVPGVGTVTLAVGPVRSTRFDGEAIESTVGLVFEETDLRLDVNLRFVPGIERLTGTPRLVVDAAQPEGLPFELDLAAAIPPIELPRFLEWELPMPRGRTMPIRCYVQGIVVDGDRLRVDLGFARTLDED